MNIIGDKIVLRAIEPKDNPLLLELINNPDVEYMVGGWVFPISERNQQEWTNELKVTKEALRCAIDVAGEAVGFISLTDIDYKNGTAEVNIKLEGKKYGGKGYATDAIRSVVRFAFDELRLNCIYAHVNEHNMPSRKMVERTGFLEEGILRKRLFKRGKYIDTISYSITKV